MDLVRKIADALEKHPQISAAGLCSTPGEYADTEGDIDIFVYCTEIPIAQDRRLLLPEFSGDYTPGVNPTRWGLCDLVYIGVMEVWLMYVTEEETLIEVKEILAGHMPNKVDNYYYPVGRLATIKNLEVLFDGGGYLKSLKKMVSAFPEELVHTLMSFHADALTDTEDLTRAALRGDVLFYHFALDLVLDHFLQALFALNRVYFPSRKRSLKYIRNFKNKPEGCEEMLLEIIKTGSESATISKSFELVQGLIKWIQGQA